MNKLSIVIVSLVLSGAAQAQVYKCTLPSGKVVFSGDPCQGSQKTEVLNVYVPRSQTSDTASADSPQVDYEQEQKGLSHRLKIDSVKLNILKTKRKVDALLDEMDSKITAIKNKKQYAKNNLAGAEWETSLSTEMQAVTSQYNVKVELEREKLKQLNSQLVALESAE